MNSPPRRFEYLRNISRLEAERKWLGELDRRSLLLPLAGESVPAEASQGRVTAEPVFAALSSPQYHSSAMDGYAVRFIDTLGASEPHPKRLLIGKQAFAIDTGDPLDKGLDAVIMVEDVELVSEAEIEIVSAATPWQHVRTVGEDIVASELILPENHQIRAMDVAAMLGAGLTEVPVREQPTVAVIPTGSELVQPGQPAPRGFIIEFNSRLLAGMARDWGAKALRHEIVADDYAQLKAAIGEAVTHHDIVVINAGSSAGREDYTVHVIDELGEVLVHGVRIRPGKPVVLGIIANTPVLGIPGYPVSAALTMDLFAKPVIYRLQGRHAPAPEMATVRISRKIPSRLGSEEFLRVNMGRVGDRLVAAPVARGAGALMSLVRADGILRIPEDSEGVRVDEDVQVELLKPLEEIENTIVAIGSHDISLDLLASELKKSFPDLTLSSAHVGSLGGLMALKRGDAHLAGTHLLDEETGEYNVSYIERYLAGVPVILVNLAYREQGLIVGRGNPKGLCDVEDLVTKDVVFINRQRGSGTRILLDFSLNQKGIDPLQIRGYDREEYSHMAVAAAVLSGSADAGMGIRAAALALGLDFVAIKKERYDLAVRRDYWESPQVKALLTVIRSDVFQQKLVNLGGYDGSRTGEIIAVFE